jgi:hypothetical protein
MEGHHFGEALAQEVFDVLEEYEISEKLFCITTDNAGNNTTLVKHLSTFLKEEKGYRVGSQKASYLMFKPRYQPCYSRFSEKHQSCSRRE